VASGEVTITAIVPLEIDAAFSAFTTDIDRWWVRGPESGTVVRFEGERLLEVSTDGAVTLATVTASVPPTHIELDWDGPHSAPGDKVIVDFVPDAGGTRVTIRHRRQGIESAGALSAVIGLWWGDRLSKLQRR